MPCGQACRQPLRIAARLDFDTAERGARLLGFDDAASLAIDVEQVIGKAKACVQREFANRNALRCMDIEVAHAADMPARLG